MIAHLTGTIINQDLTSLVIDVNGVGYRVFTNTAYLLDKNTKSISLWTHLVVREDVLDLYGFQTPEEVKFFKLLLSVSGIGPKSALGILNIGDMSNLKEAIATEDTAYLTKVSGIGKKNAQKIILELKDKLLLTEDIIHTTIKGEVEALEALEALGYSLKDAREALKDIPKDSTTINERIKAALKNLSQR